MKSLCIILISLLFCFSMPGCSHFSRKPTAVKPSALPDSYRDFKIYASSDTVEGNTSKLAVTVQMANEGQTKLKVHIVLDRHDGLAYVGDEIEHSLLPGSQYQWQFKLNVPDKLAYEVIKGKIFFNGLHARELYIAVQGPGTAGTKNAFITGAYAPRHKVDWWEAHPTSSIHPGLKKKPLIKIASRGKSNYIMDVGPLPNGPDGKPLGLEQWSKMKNLEPGERELIKALEDLHRCILIMSEADLPITNNIESRSPAIRLRLIDKREWAHPDAYHLYTKSKDVVIEAGHIDGLRQGIYGFLTDHLDCHWFMPDGLGEEVPRPKDMSVVIGQIDEERSPSFFSNRGMSWGYGGSWDQRNRCLIRRGIVSYGHAWIRYLHWSEELFKEHRDWWARAIDGNIVSGNFCSTQPEVLDIVAEKVNEILNDPTVFVASLDPNDDVRMCSCERCQALDRAYGIETPSEHYVTDRLLHFSREIYKRLDEDKRDRFLGILAYYHQIELPTSARPHNHHTAMVCNMPWSYDHTRPINDPTSPQNQKFYEILRGWVDLVTMCGFYDYYGHYSYYGPWGLAHKIREDIPLFRDLGGSYMVIEAQPNFGMHGLNLYVAARLAWDADADVDVLLEEFFHKYYGPAAEHMREFWLTIEREFALTQPGPYSQNHVVGRQDMWDLLYDQLDKAEAAVSNADQRFKDRIKFNRHGMKLCRLSAEIQKKHFQPEKQPNVEMALKDIEEGLDWLKWSKKHYAAGDEYWPTLLAPYFYFRVERDLNNLKKKLDQP